MSGSARPSAAVASALRIKILSLGDGAVGKSCLIKRYCEKKFVSRYISTIGVDFGVKNIKVYDQEVSVNFWDLSGHPEFFDVRNEFYRDTQGILLVFDVTSRRSFEKLDNWMHEANKFGAKPKVIAVCGNKIDNTGDRSVPTKEAQSWANSKGYKYFETSAKSGKGVDEAFNHLFENVVQKPPGSS